MFIVIKLLQWTCINTDWKLFNESATHQEYETAQTGKPQPNMSTTFMGRSNPEEDVWRQTPRSAAPEQIHIHDTQHLNYMHFLTWYIWMILIF